ncbi:P-loop containing nucleoside triphosphate hydrolase protein [Mucor mucedo]|uniref:P-loop containing nucleoside triphosphate hydrolase protein n=1 Tax=Mucor mucedo TaxID=29922 RepID=UPI00221E6A92|nr:P-loop containing nucleoside triphosphate hydrolase protein [Mucor mucedo]KAI7893449.1 P-loop containing nucleoside triphosphate hydrolase protein [Mucor mucedo]
MSELVKNVKGPSEWFCKNGKNCWYNEYSTLVSVFPDNIQLACDVGECVNEQDYMDVGPIDQEFSSYTELMIIGAISLACILLFTITKITASRQKKMFGTRIELSLDDDDEGDGPISTEIALTFADINYTVSGKPILSDISGYVEPGQMLAIMGPSGAGKSSLLDILSKKHKRGVTSGRILINGMLPTRRQFKRLTGFVDQDDSLMGTLTVRETLTYAALMRLPRCMPLKSIQKRVEDVIQELGINKIADSQIGMPGQRGISGGEKRRVSIGKELVTSPSLLFLDEPTSGLDAYNAGVVMACLKKLAHEGKRTVVVTIHQPRSNIFKMFDSLMLLADGQLVYFGPAKTCSSYFKDLGFPIPADYNVADYLIDLTMKRPEDAVTKPGTPLLSGEIDDDTQPLEEIHTPYSFTNDIQQEGSGELNLLSESNHSYFLLDSFYSSDLFQTIQNRVGRSENEDEINYSVWVDAPGQEESAFSIYQFYHELSLLSSRTFINLYRNPFLFFAHFGFSVLLAVLLGSLFWQVDVDLSGVQNRLGVLFFMCALLGFAATSALDMFNKERILFMRERENGYYTPGAYFVAKVLFDVVPLRVLPPLVMGSISYYMIGLNPSIHIFGKFLLVLVLFNLAAAGLCLCFATAFKNLSAANLLANLVILFSMLFGGFLLNKDHIPPMLSWLQYLSFFNYGYEALIVNELKDITLRDKSIADIQIPGPIILARFGFNGQAFWSDVIRLICFVLVTLTTSFLFLKYLVKERR